MQGLLDFFNDKEKMAGLLQMGSGMMQGAHNPGGRFGPAFGAGVQGYAQGIQQHQENEAQKQQRELLNQQRQMQIAQIQRQQALEAKRAQTLGMLGGLKNGSPTVENAQNPQQYTAQDIQKMLLAAGDIEGASALQGLQGKQQLVTVQGPDGRPVQKWVNPGDEVGALYQKETDPLVLEAEIKKAQALAKFKQGNAADPYFTPIQTGQGVFSFNARNGQITPITVDGQRIVGSGSDPNLQGTIAGAKAEGKERAEARVALPGAIAKAEQSVQLIDQLLQHPGRTTATGLSAKLDPRNLTPGTEAYNFNVMSKQLQGKAFLEAFESLKGGGQITQIEGEKATEAIARLSTAQSEKAYTQALNELKSIIQTGVSRSKQRAGGMGVAQEQSATTPKATKRYNPATGKVESY